MDGTGGNVVDSVASFRDASFMDTSGEPEISFLSVSSGSDLVGVVCCALSAPATGPLPLPGVDGDFCAAGMALAWAWGFSEVGVVASVPRRIR